MMTDNVIPPDAEAFLSRLTELPAAAWDEILAYRRPGPRRLLRVLGRAVRDILTLPFRRHKATAGDLTWSETAIRRVFELFKAGALPKRLGARGLALVLMAAQAVCLRASLTPDQVARAYAPFEPFVPLASIGPPEGPGSGGA
jgi:hypothetical protein